MKKHTTNKQTLLPLAAAVGTSLALSLATIPIANADTANPFSVTKLKTGYNLASHDKEGSCGSNIKDKEGKCGEGKCGEGKCGGDMKDKAKEKVDDAKDKTGKMKERNCGEGKCGGE